MKACGELGRDVWDGARPWAGATACSDRDSSLGSFIQAWGESIGHRAQLA